MSDELVSKISGALRNTEVGVPFSCGARQTLDDALADGIEFDPTDDSAATIYEAGRALAASALSAIQASLPDEVNAMVEKMGAALEEVQDRDRPLPWVVHTGSSYRRIASEPTPENGYRGFPDGNVLHGVVDRHDGHHDLSMGEDHLTALVEIVNATPTLLAMLTCLSARIAELETNYGRTVSASNGGSDGDS